MSWSDLLGAAEPQLRASAAESARFDLDVDRLLVPRDSGLTDAEVVDRAGASTSDLLVLRYPAERVGLFAALLATGRTVLMADQLVYWTLPTGQGRAPQPDPAIVTRAVTPADTDQLVPTLVAEIFSAYGNHYLADPLLDPDHALAGYQEWARSSALTGEALVTERDGVDVALATLGRDAEADVLEIELAGVLAAHQGQGLYPHLLAAIEQRAIADDIGQVVISTQTHNARVQRGWARYGFEPVQTFATIHLVRRDLLP